MVSDGKGDGLDSRVAVAREVQKFGDHCSRGSRTVLLTNLVLC